jgi:hypothetical protein
VQGVAADGLFGYVEIPLTILGPTPVVSVSDDQLEWEESATIHGERYAPGAQITVSLFPNNTPLAEGTAGSDGSFDIPFSIPTNLFSSRDYQLAVTGQGIDLLFHFDIVNVTIIGDRPIIDVATDQARRGGTVDVRGELFLKGTEVQFTLLPGFEKLGTAAVGDDGTFATTVTIPTDAFAKDPHQLVVTGQGADGLFAYDGAFLAIDGDTASQPGATVSTLAAGDPIAKPNFERFVDRFLGVPPTAPRRGESSNLGLVVFLLMLLLLLVLLVTSRRRRRR